MFVGVLRGHGVQLAVSCLKMTVSVRIMPADKPKDNRNATPDAMKTLFVGRLAYDTTEEKLLAELGEFGIIVQVIAAVSGVDCRICRWNVIVSPPGQGCEGQGRQVSWFWFRPV